MADYSKQRFACATYNDRPAVSVGLVRTLALALGGGAPRRGRQASALEMGFTLVDILLG